MGIQDAATKRYVKRNDIFAALFNYFVYDGEQRLYEDCLTEADSADSLLWSDDKGKRHIIERYRDVLKKCVLKYTGDMCYLLIGIENQSEIHYAMPARNMLYDAISYTEQISQMQLSHKEKGTKLSKPEFLSGMAKEDKLVPVLTLVVYWGQEDWDAPCSLHEMFADTDEKVLGFINDYRINLVNPHRMQEEDFEKLGESLSMVMRFIKASASEKQMRELLERFVKEYSELERDAAEVIAVCTNIEIEVEEKGEVIDMCKAWEEHWESGREQGMKQGEAKGLEQGVKQGIKQGVEQGMAKQLITSVTAVMKSLKLSVEEACKVLNVETEAYEKAKKLCNETI